MQVPPARVVAQFDVICPVVVVTAEAASVLMHLCPAAFVAQDALSALEATCKLQLS